jgi:RNA polymerase sigma factor (sigma-70 family)
MSDRAEEYAWFFRTEFTSVVRTAYLVLHDVQRAEDVAQEAFTQLYIHWSKISRYERPEAWVRRVAIRKAIKEQRRERRRAELERVDTAAARDPLSADLGLADALRALAPQQRAAIALFYLEDRPVHEVAGIIGCSPSTAKVHLHRGRQRLMEILGEEWVDDAI